MSAPLVKQDSLDSTASSDSIDYLPSLVEPSKILPFHCLICNKPARCCHYGVPACDGCKTFFRRALVSNNVVPCRTRDRCELVKAATQRFCRNCRFEKCISVGMDPSAVEKRPHRVSMVALKKRMYETQMGLRISATSCIGVDINGLLYTEKKVTHLRHSFYFPYCIHQGIDDIMVKFWPKRPSNITDLSKGLDRGGSKLWFYLDAVLAIEFYKTLHVFSILSHSDQHALIRGTCLQLCVFQGAIDSYFRGHFRGVVQPDGYIPYGIIYSDDRVDRIAEHVRVSIVPSCKRSNLTEEQAMLIKVIIALNSAAPNLSREARDLLLEERVKYVNALRHLAQVENPHAWLRHFTSLYDLVNRNLQITSYMIEMFYLRYMPLLTNLVPDLAKLTSELFFQ
ncbi:hypothetical protein QR680_017868 [Steinernema hermaphroditum]|uniref:Nuclear receptor domain-containing protein n=1 Tax=Steinernema hermaphroditum TaxID=289476 RepID=A0AA39LQ30_9BILA|nr:hypothetical protein QR680_017868 [Steinernema hermaphroditum]